METREHLRQSLKARVEELDRQLDLLAERIPRSVPDSESRLRALRMHLDEIRARLREREGANDGAHDGSLADLGIILNEMAEEMSSWP